MYIYIYIYIYDIRFILIAIDHGLVESTLLCK